MFKPHDRVRFLEAYGGVPAGSLATVTKVDSCTVPEAKQLVYVHVDGGQKTVLFDFRLELVDGSFNISTATDVELADELRRVLGIRNTLHNALRDRGYTIGTDGYNNLQIVEPDKYIIRKVETKETKL